MAWFVPLVKDDVNAHMVSKWRVAGFTLVELLVILAIVATLIGMILPANRHRTAARIKCVNNLKNVGLAFRIFASDNQGAFPMRLSTNQGGSLEFVNEGAALRHFLALSNELSTPLILACPLDTKRKPANNFALAQHVNVSYFVGLDATEAEAGDPPGGRPEPYGQWTPGQTGAGGTDHQRSCWLDGGNPQSPGQRGYGRRQRAATERRQAC